jgi:hypothetical protein
MNRLFKEEEIQIANKWMKKMFSSSNENANQNNTNSVPPQLVWQLSRTQTTTNVGKDVGKRELSNTVVGNVNWNSHCGKQYDGSSKN